MTSRSINIREMQVPVEAIRRLPNETRFSYYLLGHIFNELMALQKIIKFSLPQHQDVRPARIRAEQAQAFFLFRLACGKVWEAYLAINSKEISKTLQELVLPRMADGRNQLKALNKSVSDAAWLSHLRNGMAFHFPDYADWEAYVMPNDSWEDDKIFLSDMTGNTFYDASANIAHHWMFDRYGLPDPKDAVDPLTLEMIALLGSMNGFIEVALGTFVSEVLLEGKSQDSPIEKVVAQSLRRCRCRSGLGCRIGRNSG